MVIKFAHENIYMREEVCSSRKCIVSQEGIINRSNSENMKKDRFFDPDVKGEGTRKGILSGKA